MSEKISREEAVIELTKAVAPAFAESNPRSGQLCNDIALCVLNLLSVAGYVAVKTHLNEYIKQSDAIIINDIPTPATIQTLEGHPLHANTSDIGLEEE